MTPKFISPGQTYLLSSTLIQLDIIILLHLYVHRHLMLNMNEIELVIFHPKFDSTLAHAPSYQ